jgi:hypothetical protein
VARFFPSTDRETAWFGTKLIDETNESMPVLLVQRGVAAHRYTKIEMASCVSAATELKGLDIPEMGSLGYNPDAEFYEPQVALVAGGVTISGGGSK